MVETTYPMAPGAAMPAASRRRFREPQISVCANRASVAGVFRSQHESSEIERAAGGARARGARADADRARVRSAVTPADARLASRAEVAHDRRWRACGVALLQAGRAVGRIAAVDGARIPRDLFGRGGARNEGLGSAARPGGDAGRMRLRTSGPSAARGSVAA